MNVHRRALHGLKSQRRYHCCSFRRLFCVWALVAAAGVVMAADRLGPKASTKASAGAGTEKTRAVTMKLESAAFRPRGYLPTEYTCDGQDVSPELVWSGLPGATTSVALIMDDPDAPPGTWVHWVVYDIPARPAVLAKGISRESQLGNGAKQGLVWGVDGFDRIGYWGPCPPPGKPHRYVFKLYALSQPTGLKAGATKKELLRAIDGHVLARTQLVGLYQR